MHQLIGYSAGILTTLAFVPQVVKSWRSNSVSDLSFTMLITFTAGVCLWLAYGVELGSMPMIVANATTLVLTGILLALKLQQKRR